ncbi:GvpL/GvpF family gas vesicle protein [Allostreptomyces psammosilenae]|uniref:Gas vesicle protein n=1 Tax=Allostreptomyces psammosilenae TaxID=1892865 RepID=A0A853A3H3_9ACTN|nr:GvpL/GvpF family gas vesicle protein [Allostreptomyces psammosilenae]NYI05062.1 hypothetical protein [Allostreptomyces psammosilenae]
MAVYVYAVTDASHPLRLDGLPGVGDPPGELRTVRGGPLAAVVSDAPGELRPKRRDLVAHQDVQERLIADGTALPLRFGLVAPDDAAVKAELTERAEHYQQRLRELRGRVEFNLKVGREEESLLREILLDTPRARELNDAIRAGQDTQETRMALGELVAQEVQARQEAFARDVVDALRPVAHREFVSPAKDDLVNASFLVDHDRAEEFAAAERKLADQYGEDYRFRLRGPLPPYSFV